MAGNKNRNARRKQNKQRNVHRANDGPIPPVWRALFRWPIYNTMSAAAGLVSTYGFRLNGMFDPDFTGIGNQPSYFDQFSAMYTKYRVTSSTIKLQLFNTSTSPVAYVVLATTRNSGVVNLIGDSTAKNSIYGCLAPNGSGASGKKINKSYSMAQLWGCTEAAVRSEDDFSALSTGNPNNVLYLWIGARAVDGAAFSLGYTLEIGYNAEMYMPITIGPS